MNVKTCYGCALRFTGVIPKQVRCAILTEKLTHITPGSGFTAIEFKCPTRDAIFKPGEPVIFEAWSRDRAESGLSDYYGWVWKMSGRKVVVVSAETDKPMLRFYTSQLTRNPGEEWKRCCIHCGKPEGVMTEVYKTEKSMSPLPNGPGLYPYVCRVDYDKETHEEIPLPCEFKEVNPNDQA